jgi:hypothetical protein
MLLKEHSGQRKGICKKELDGQDGRDIGFDTRVCPVWIRGVVGKLSAKRRY